MAFHIIFIFVIIFIKTKITSAKVILDTPDFVVEQFEVGEKFKKELEKASSRIIYKLKKVFIELNYCLDEIHNITKDYFLLTELDHLKYSYVAKSGKVH